MNVKIIEVYIMLRKLAELFIKLNELIDSISSLVTIFNESMKNNKSNTTICKDPKDSSLEP